MSLQSRLEALVAAIGPDIKRSKGLTDSLSTDQTKATSVYGASGMSVSLEAGKTYQVRTGGTYNSSVTNSGLGVQMAGTCTASLCVFSFQIWGYAAQMAYNYVQNSLASTPLPSTQVIAAGFNYAWRGEGLITCSAAGTLTLQWRPNGNFSAVLRQGSFLRAYESNIT